MTKTPHKHHPDCKHNHRHNAACEHGTPTAIPSRRTCGVCNEPMQDPYYCGKHFRWECSSHKVQSHGDGEWVAITRKTAQRRAEREMVRAEA